VSDLDFDVSKFFSIMRRLEQSAAIDLLSSYGGPTRQHKQIGEIIPVFRCLDLNVLNYIGH
jgi:hypothetical protein